MTELATFNVLASTGSAGSESQAWAPVAVTKSGSTYLTGKYWPAVDPSYHFYASNAALTFAAAGSTVIADGSTDVVCAYLPSPTYGEPNALTFDHIYARVGSFSVATQSGYEISAVSATLKNGVSGGTYNLRTGAWSGLSAASDRACASFSGSTSSQSSSNDIWLVPGTYTISVSYTLTKGEYVVPFTKTGSVTLVAGKTNNISTTAVGGSASEIVFSVSLATWGTNPVEMEFVDYLAIEALGNGVIKWKDTDNPEDYGGDFFSRTIEYSKDGGATWTSITSSYEGSPIAVENGDVVLFRGDNSDYYRDWDDDLGGCAGSGFSFSVPCNVSGNINTLLGTKSMGSYAFGYLFSNCSIVDAGELVLSATMLADYCYYNMFQGCTSLTSAPALPATTLVDVCYGYMFQGCTSLTSAPALPATTLAYDCYYGMFQGCTSLATAPALPATTLVDNCYGSMFQGCTSLTSAPALPATTLFGSCYSYMFKGCTSLTSAPALPATTLVDGCYYSMFQGCTSLTSAPALPATTLADYCYSSMFRDCTSLASAPALPATTLVDGCYSYMFYGCTSLTSAPALPATTLVDACYCKMFYGCTSLSYVKCLLLCNDADEMNERVHDGEITYEWLKNVSSTGTFVKNPSMTLWPSGVNGIPSGWTVQNAE